MPVSMNDPQCCVAILQTFRDHADGTNIIQIGEVQVLFLHLAPDAVDMFRAAIHFGINTGIVQCGFRISNKLLDVTFTIEPFFIQQFSDLFVSIRMQITE